MNKGIFKRLGETIVAPATPPGKGAVHVLRLSGKACRSIIKRRFKRVRGRGELTAWRQYLGWLHKDGRPVEKAMVCCSYAPRSYTGQDCLEIYCHGGEASRRAVLQLMLESGCRLALAGEFTARAYLAGKLDLVQAEALGEMAEAGSERERRAALGQLRGGLSGELAEIRAATTRELARLEVALDGLGEAGGTKRGLRGLAKRLDGLRQRAREGRAARGGVRCVIAGYANAGKSTLFNRLLGEERTITSARPGTTRDSVRQRLALPAGEITLVDSAGLEQARGGLERAASERAAREAGAAELVLLVVDASRPLAAGRQRRLAGVARGEKLVVINKLDLPRRLRLAEALRGKQVALSARSGRGVGALRAALNSWLRRRAGEDALVLSERQERLVEELAACARRAEEAAARGSEELAAEEMREMLELLGALSGEKVSERVLEEIFRSFCIGK